MAVQLRDRPWTYADLEALPDDGKRHEIVDGVLFEMPAPNIRHILTLSNLVALLSPIVAAVGARLVPAIADVFFPGADPVEPDLFVLLPGSRVRLVRRGIEGAPDLVIEVLSPSNRAHDTLTKRALYGRGGVRAYWIVDPEAQTVEVLALAGDALQSVGVFAGDDRLASAVLPGVAFAAAEVFAGFDEIGG